MLRYLPLALLLGAPLAAAAQTTYLRRAVAVQPELQVELAPNERSYVYAALGGLRFTDYDAYATTADRTLGLDAGYLALGYERLFAKSTTWSWGPTLRLAAMHYRSFAVQPGVLLRHSSHVGPLAFGQRLGAEVAVGDNYSRLDPAYEFNSLYGAPSRLLLRLRLDLRYSGYLHVSNWLAVSPRVSFEPALFLRLQREEYDLDKRTIDYTGLRGDVTLRFNKLWLDVTPYFALQTRYYRTLVQYGPNGSPTSNGKFNSLLPTAGLEVRYSLRHSIPVEGHFEVPTQH